MRHLSALALLAQDGEGLDPNSVSPGLLGFLATFGVVVVSILLFLNMAGRLRRMRYREERDAERLRGQAVGSPDDAPDGDERRPPGEGRDS
ncbi:MAG: hypothetical protein ACLGIV_14165 [Actinomycetes bacterium]